MHALADLGAVVVNLEALEAGRDVRQRRRYRVRVPKLGIVKIALRQRHLRDRDRRLGGLAEAEARGADQHRHISVRVLVVVHKLVTERQFLIGERPRHAGVELAGKRQLVHRVALLVVGEVRTLESLLPHPKIAEVDGRVVAGRAGANDDDAAGIADEHRGGDGRLAGMLENHRRATLLAENLPDRRAECAHALQPIVVTDRVFPVRQHAPMIEFAAIYAALRAQLGAVVDLVVAGDDRDRNAVGRLGDLNGHRTEPARAAPDQHRITRPHVVLGPAMQHAPGGGGVFR